MTGLAQRARQAVGGLVDASPSRRRQAARTLATAYARRGANTVLLEDAVEGAGARSFAATRAVMRWAAALEGRGPMPERFRPDRLLVGDAARTEARRLLERNLATSPDPVQQRQLSMLTSDGPSEPTSEEVDAVNRLLDDRLAEVAVATPPAAPGPGAADHTLDWLDGVLRDAGHRPFLMSGTLLGVVRQGRLLDHDYDLDLGLLPGDGSAAEVGAVLSAHDDVTIVVEDGRVWGRHANGVAFDVFCHTESDGRYWHVTGAHAWWNTPFDVVEIDVGHRRYFVPEDAPRYLDENYGDWGRPVAFFDKNIDTPNLQWRHTTEALYYLHDIVIEATGPRPDRARAEAAIAALKATFGIDLSHHLPGAVS